MSSSVKLILKKKPYQEGKQRIQRKVTTLQEERLEIVGLIDGHVEKAIATADALLNLDKDHFFKIYRDVNQELESCLDKLLCCKAQLYDSSTLEDEEEEGEGEGQGQGLEGEGVNGGGSSRAMTRGLSQEEQALVERIKQQGVKRDSLLPDSLDSFEANESMIKEMINEQNKRLDAIVGFQPDVRKDSTFTEDLNSNRSTMGSTSDRSLDLPPPHTGPRRSLGGGGDEDQQTSQPTLGQEHGLEQGTLRRFSYTKEDDPDPDTAQYYGHLKAFSNQDFIFRAADMRAEGDEFPIGFGETVIRLSLPEPLLPSSSGMDQRPSLTRTPELANINQKRQQQQDQETSRESGQQGEAVGQSVSASSLTASTITAKYTSKSRDVGTFNEGEMSEEEEEEAALSLPGRINTPLTPNGSNDHFDTASSELYVSQEVLSSSSPPTKSGLAASKYAEPPTPPPLIIPMSKPPSGIKPPSGDAVKPTPKPSTLVPPNLKIAIGCHASVRISHITTPSDFWVHYNRELVNLLYNEVQFNQERYVQHNNAILSLLEAGLICATKYSSDCCWYRVKIIDIGPKSIEVMFIDYGYNGTVPWGELFALCPTLAERPVQAVHCFLKGVTGPAGIWTLKAIEEFKNSVSFYSIRAYFYQPIEIKTTGQSMYPVDLFLDWGSDEMNNVLLYLSPTEFIHSDQWQEQELELETLGTVIETLAQESFPKSEHEMNAENIQNQNQRKESIGMTINWQPSNQLKVDPPHVPDKEYLLTVISHILSPSEFYVHVLSEEDGGVSHLDDLREQLNEYYSNNADPVELPEDLNQLTNTFWACIYPNDSSWYRVRVIQLLDEPTIIDNVVKPKQVLAQYIDFGNTEVVSVTDLRPLHADLAQVPALAVRCHLAHIRPLDTFWTEDAIHFFESVSGFEQETVVTGHVICRPNRIDFDCSLSILLWNSGDAQDEPPPGSGTRDVLINALLVKEQMAATDSLDWVEEAERSLIGEKMMEERVDMLLREEEEDVLVEEAEGGGEAEALDPGSVEEPQPFPINDLQLDSIVLLKVTSVESPYSFFGFFPYGLETLDETGCDSLQELIHSSEAAPHTMRFKNLMEEMKACYSGHCEPFLGALRPGSLVAVDVDGKYFRARVVQEEEGNAFRVKCIDTGACPSVARTMIYPLKDEFCGLPGYAVHCFLANVEPIGAVNQWPAEATKTFKEYTLRKAFAAHVISIENNTIGVELLGIEEDNAVSVCELMVSLGQAKESPNKGPLLAQISRILALDPNPSQSAPDQSDDDYGEGNDEVFASDAEDLSD